MWQPAQTWETCSEQLTLSSAWAVPVQTVKAMDAKDVASLDSTKAS